MKSPFLPNIELLNRCDPCYRKEKDRLFLDKIGRLFSAVLLAVACKKILRVGSAISFAVISTGMERTADSESTTKLKHSIPDLSFIELLSATCSSFHPFSLSFTIKSSKVERKCLRNSRKVYKFDIL